MGPKLMPPPYKNFLATCLSPAQICIVLPQICPNQLPNLNNKYKSNKYKAKFVTKLYIIDYCLQLFYLVHTHLPFFKQKQLLKKTYLGLPLRGGVYRFAPPQYQKKIFTRACVVFI